MLYSIFEDLSSNSLLPLAHCQPVFDLRCGAFTARERATRLFGTAPASLLVRDYLRDCVHVRTGHQTAETTIKPSVFLNGRLILTEKTVETLLAHDASNTAFIVGNDIGALVLNEDEAATKLSRDLHHAKAADLPESIKRVELDAKIIEFPWQLIEANRDMLLADLKQFPLGTLAQTAIVADSVELIEPASIYIADDAKIGSGVVIDASDGPVVIDHGAVLMHKCVVIGPAYIGTASKVKIGAKIYENTSIGPVCKVGGEIEGSILAGYANKQHDGFLGHSYLAPWTNLGADTNNSDLKNNYSTVRMILEGEEHESGTMSLGLVCADHSKSAINTMFNTGTAIGVGCNIFGGGFPPKYVPSFSWGGSEGIYEYQFDRFIKTAERVMARRDIVLTDAERVMLQHVFDSTSDQRKDT
jgi:UDP-N-acetylglucosamine diphosphorylase/glucosamine-1-phosphate N-acetyltransferase